MSRSDEAGRRDGDAGGLLAVGVSTAAELESIRADDYEVTRTVLPIEMATKFADARQV